MNAVNPQHAPLRSQAADRAGGSEAEPSMEEILASIRRIIADDQASPSADLAGLSPPASPSARFPHRPSRPLPAAAEPVEPAEPFGPAPGAGDARDDVAAFDQPTAYGQVTAPQFPSLAGPAAELYEEGVEATEATWALREGSRPPVPGFAARRAADTSGHSPQQDRRMRDQLARETPVEATRDLAGDAAARSTGLFSVATDQSLSAAFNMLAATRLADDSEQLRALAREMIRPLLKSWLDDNLPSLVERLVRAEIERVARGGR